MCTRGRARLTLSCSLCRTCVANVQSQSAIPFPSLPKASHLASFDFDSEAVWRAQWKRFESMCVRLSNRRRLDRKGFKIESKGEYPKSRLTYPREIPCSCTLSFHEGRLAVLEKMPFCGTVVVVGLFHHASSQTKPSFFEEISTDFKSLFMLMHLVSGGAQGFLDRGWHFMAFDLLVLGSLLVMFNH